MNPKSLLILASSAFVLLCASCSRKSDSSSTPPSSSEEPSSSVGASSSEEPSSETPSSEIPSSSVDETAALLESAGSVITTASTKTSLISGGTINYSQASPKYETSSSDTISYEFGTDDNGDVLHYSRTQYSHTYDYYIMKDKDGGIVAVQKDSDGDINNYTSVEFEAVAFPFNYVFGYSTYFFGTEDLASSLFDIGKTDPNKDLSISYADETYCLSFGYLYTDSYGSNSYYAVDLDFKAGSQGELSYAKAVSTSYYSSDYDVDPEYNTVTLHSDAVASYVYTWEISQTSGARTFENPYDVDGFYATSFDLVYREETLTSDSVIKGEVSGDSLSVTFANVLPTTTSFSFDEIEVSVIDGDEDGVYAYYSSWSEKISISGYTAGTYTIQVASKNVTKTFKATFTDPEPTSISLSYSTYGVEEYSANTCGDEIDAYAGVEVVFQSSILPYAATQDVTASVTKAAAEDYSFASKSVAISDWYTADCYCFTAATAGDYTLKFESAVASSIYQEVTVHVAETPTFAEILEDDYAAKSRNSNHNQELRYYFTFSPNADDLGATGSVVIEDRFNDKSETMSYYISKGEDAYEFTLIHASGDELGITLKMGFDYSLKMFESDDESGSGKLLSKANFAFLVSGTWTGEDKDTTLNLSLDASKTVGFQMYDSSWDTYVYFEGAYELLSVDDDAGYSLRIVETKYTSADYMGDITLPIDFSINGDLTALSIAFTYGGASYSFALEMDV